MTPVKIPPYIRTSNRPLSIWQSAVAETVRQSITALQPGSSVIEINQLVMQHHMVLGTNLHVARHKTNAAALSPGDIEDLVPAEGTAAADIHPLVHSYLSEQFFNKAMAQRSGDVTITTTEPVSFPYSNYAWMEWLQAGENWASYDGMPVPYVDWQLNNENIDSFAVITIPENSKIVILGDFGTGLPDSCGMLMAILQQQSPDFIIHLGDIYYSGTETECTCSYTEVFTYAFNALGMKPIPVFSLPGNHEYITAGEGYFQSVVPMNASNGLDAAYQQSASYFCLRTAGNNWQFLGMDTGLNSDMANSSSDLTGITYAPWLRFSEAQWHVNKLQSFGQLNPAGKTILLSHHQFYSASSVINDPPGTENSRLTYQPGTDPSSLTYLNGNLLNVFYPFFYKIAAWFWGHEHILGIFEDGQAGLAKGRLVGSSGYEEWQGETPYDSQAGAYSYTSSPPVEADITTVSFSGDNYNFYNHAFAVIQLNGAAATVNYFQYPLSSSPYAEEYPSNPLPTPSSPPESALLPLLPVNFQDEL